MFFPWICCSDCLAAFRSENETNSEAPKKRDLKDDFFLTLTVRKATAEGEDVRSA
jgi:hypothetical protein